MGRVRSGLRDVFWRFFRRCLPFASTCGGNGDKRRLCVRFVAQMLLGIMLCRFFGDLIGIFFFAT